MILIVVALKYKLASSDGKSAVIEMFGSGKEKTRAQKDDANSASRWDAVNGTPREETEGIFLPSRWTMSEHYQKSNVMLNLGRTGLMAVDVDIFVFCDQNNFQRDIELEAWKRRLAV